jgi:hypothetical protein
MNHHAGFYVWINGERFWSGFLERLDAEDACFTKYLKKHFPG